MARRRHLYGANHCGPRSKVLERQSSPGRLVPMPEGWTAAAESCSPAAWLCRWQEAAPATCGASADPSRLREAKEIPRSLTRPDRQDCFCGQFGNKNRAANLPSPDGRRTSKVPGRSERKARAGPIRTERRLQSATETECPDQSEPRPRWESWRAGLPPLLAPFASLVQIELSRAVPARLQKPEQVQTDQARAAPSEGPLRYESSR